MTQQEIAKALNISRSTVARALNNSGYVKKEIKEKILQFAKENNYTPNFNARILASPKKMRVLNFSVDTYIGDYYREQIYSIKKTLSLYTQYDIEFESVLLDVNHPEKHPDIIEKQIAEKIPDAVLLNTFSSDRIADLIEKYHSSVLFITLSMEQPSEFVALHVGPDYYTKGKLIAELFQKFLQPQSEILMFNSALPYPSATKAFDGFFDSMIRCSDFQLRDTVYIHEDLNELYYCTKEQIAVQKIQGIYSSLSIYPVAAACREMIGSAQEFPVLIANELSYESIELLKQDKIKCIIYEQTSKMYRLAVMYLIRHFFEGAAFPAQKYTTLNRPLFREEIWTTPLCAENQLKIFDDSVLEYIYYEF